MTGRPPRGEGLTAAQVERFKKCWYGGIEITFIAERFGLTESGVSALAKRLGLAQKVIRRSRILGILAAILIAGNSLAHTGDDPVSVWYRSLVNSKGEYCCNVSDCKPPYSWRQMIGHGYQVQVSKDAPWLDVPTENILHRENMIGDAVACVVGGQVRCFIPPADT